MSGLGALYLVIQFRQNSAPEWGWGIRCLGIRKYKQLYLVQAVDIVGENAGGRAGEIMSPFPCFALSALTKIWGPRCMWHLLDKVCRTITGCTGTCSNVSVLKLQGRTEQSAYCWLVKFIASDLKSFWLPQLFLSSLHTRVRMGD